MAKVKVSRQVVDDNNLLTWKTMRIEEDELLEGEVPMEDQVRS